MTEKENFCNIVMYKLFPTSDSAIKTELRMVEHDIDKLYKDLKEEQSIANELKQTLKKLKNTRIAMDPNGMSRADAIKSTEMKALLVLNKIKIIQNEINVFEGSKYTMENSQMTVDMNKRIKSLHKRMQKVKTINAEDLENDIDDIADVNENVEKINQTINDTMVSAWTVDMESDEAMLREFLEESDNEEEDIESAKAPIVETMPRKPIQLPQLSRPKEENLTPVRELF